MSNITTTNIKHSSETSEQATPPEVCDATRLVFDGRIILDPASSKWMNEHGFVKAKRIYTKEDNALVRPWKAENVFNNPPGSLCDEDGNEVIRAKKDPKGKRIPPCTETGACGLKAPHTHSGVTSYAKFFWKYLVREWLSGRTQEAIFMGFSMEILQSTQSKGRAQLLPLQFPCCYPASRLNFWVRKGNLLVEGTQPTHGNVIVYLPTKAAPTSVLYEDRKEAFHNAFGKIGHVVWPSDIPQR